MEAAVERTTTATRGNVDIRSMKEQFAQRANKFELEGQGNMNNIFGNGNNYDVGSGGVVHSVAQNSGHINYYTSTPISSRDKLARWLNSCGDKRARQTNYDDYGSHEQIIQDETRTWLFSAQEYEHWTSVASTSANTTSPNVLWLSGDAGFGKSVLCAHAIRQQSKLWADDGAVAVTYQFYKMNNESENPMTAYLTLAEMLFKERFPRLDDKVPDEISAICAYSPNQYRLCKLIELLVREFKAIYIFVDGLDEIVDAVDKNRWSYAKHFLDFILKLAVGTRSPGDDFDTVIKVWVSSQRRKEINHAIFSRIPGTSTVSTSRPSSSIMPLVQIALTTKSNRSDISAMFRRELEAGRYYDLSEDEGSKVINIVLDILQRAVKGNFLWARLMLDSLANASSLGQIVEAFEKVPDDFRAYLGNRIRTQLDRHPESRRKDAAHILSCLMYAERPLLVDELCEAVCAYRIAKAGQNMQEEDKPFKAKIEEICAPLVRVDEKMRNGQKVAICSLYHSAVRHFLLEAPNILVPDSQDDQEPGAEEYIVSPRVLGRACMRYLQQKRYKHPLLCPPATDGRGFLTSGAEQEDINTQAFLTYCAKYWARHHEYPGACSEELCNEIESFVSSSHFRTTLQVQSLFVQSRFCFLFSVGHEDRGRHLVRAFPSFFTEQCIPGNEIQKQYSEAIGEFGYFLDSHCSFRGGFDGQIHRCPWGMLGSSNIFHRVSNHWKGFKLEAEENGEHQSLCFYHDNVDVENGRITLYSVMSRLISKDTLRLELELFTIKPGHSPRFKAGQFDPITVAGEKLDLYQRPLRDHFPGRPRAVALSPDGRVLRVGSEVFVLDGGSLRRLELENLPAEENMDFFEEIGNRGPWVAIGRRRKVTSADLDEEEEHEDPQDEVPDGGNNDEDGVSSDGFSASPMSSSGSESETDDEEADSDDENNPASSRQASGQEEPQKEKEQKIMEGSTVESDLDSADQRSVCCSARESCSPGSTSIQSDEIGQDDDFWNDWLSDDDELQIKDINDDNLSDNFDAAPPSDDLEDVFDDIAEADDEKETESEIPSHLSGIESDDAWSDSNDGSEKDPVGVIFHDRRKLRPNPPSKVIGNKNNGTAHVCELLVLNTDRSASAAVKSPEGRDVDNKTSAGDARPSLRVFRFVRKATGLLFSSPPAIHPTHNLLIWPLGGDEVLFAHFSPTEKTYFTTLLDSGSRGNMCHISVQPKFSPCGQYLHIACLDGAVEEKIDAASRPTKEISELRLRVSTYRLSRRKTARSLPRLIYRMSCPLRPAYCSSKVDGTGDGRMPVTPLPWTLSWDWSDSDGGGHVYACQSNPYLHVVRAPLFAHVEARERAIDGIEGEDDGDALPAFMNSQPVFLPRSALSRRVHFFPHHPGTGSTAKEVRQRGGNKNKTKQKGKDSNGGKHRDLNRERGGDGAGEQVDDPYVATVVISSEDAKNTPGSADTRANNGSRQHGENRASGYRGRAQVAQLTKTQLGGWRRLRYSEMGRDNSPKNRAPTRMETWRGQLVSKYEKFDKTDDCDIVPYIW